jgi:flagellar biosynthesis/type III secretory pathway protein FliH
MVYTPKPPPFLNNRLTKNVTHPPTEPYTITDTEVTRGSHSRKSSKHSGDQGASTNLMVRSGNFVKNFYKQNYVDVNMVVATLAAAFIGKKYGQNQHDKGFASGKETGTKYGYAWGFQNGETQGRSAGFDAGVNQYLQL